MHQNRRPRPSGHSSGPHGHSGGHQGHPAGQKAQSGQQGHPGLRESVRQDLCWTSSLDYGPGLHRDTMGYGPVGRHGPVVRDTVDLHNISQGLLLKFFLMKLG